MSNTILGINLQNLPYWVYQIVMSYKARTQSTAYMYLINAKVDNKRYLRLRQTIIQYWNNYVDC